MASGPAAGPRAQTSAAAAAGDADALYAAREDLASAQRAEAIWAARLAAKPDDFEAAWKLARARYWIGTRVPRDEGRRVLEAGIEAARAARRMQPGRAEGPFWMAANMGALAESFGLRQGLRYRGAIREALLEALTIDPAFQQGSPDRALGRWYHKVPRLFGGSQTRSEEHLRRALTYNPDSTITRYFLAETLIALDRRGEARTELQRVLEAPIDPAWAPEDREFKAQARKLLQSMQAP